MVNGLFIVAAALIGYLCGAIPFGFLYVKTFKGVDVRQHGSGRTGGTNSMRAGGLGIGILTSLSDVFKGYLAVWLVQTLLGAALGDWLPWAIVATAVMVVVGHNWSVFLGWRGGAGTGPNVGWASALWWPMFPIAFLVMAGLLLGVGMASVASLAMGVTIPIVFAIRYFGGYDPTPAYMIAGLLTLAVVAWALRPNIRRVLDGTERLVGPRAKQQKRRSPS